MKRILAAPTLYALTLLTLLTLFAAALGANAQTKNGSLPAITSVSSVSTIPITTDNGHNDWKMTLANLSTSLNLITSLGTSNWVSAAGVLYPSPAVDTVTITSAFTNGSSTNVALMVDTAVPWTNGYPLQILNAGVPQAGVAWNGAIISGAHSTNWWGEDVTGIAFLSSAETSLGDHWFREIVNRVAHDDTHFGIFEADIETNQVYLNVTVKNANLDYGARLDATDLDTDFYLLVGSQTLTELHPTVATGSAVAYLFDTANSLLAGDKLLNLANHGTNKLFVSNLGAIAAGGNTNQWGTGGVTTGVGLTINATNYISITVNGIARKLALAD
jgi:hypothetical protein